MFRFEEKSLTSPLIKPNVFNYIINDLNVVIQIISNLFFQNFPIGRTKLKKMLKE